MRSGKSDLRRTIGACAAAALAGLLGSRAQATTQVTAGKARFEFLTPSLVRMEYAPSGVFIERPTAVVHRRDWPAVAARSIRRDGWLIVTTSALELRYRLDSGAFTAANLRITWKGADSSPREWHPGVPDPGNLGGLTYSLDNISRTNLPTSGDDLGSPQHDVIPGIDILLQPATPGLLSRSGFAFLDDSTSPVWNRQHSWIEPRRGANGEDWYLFVYNRHYRRVLREYAELCGPIPMIPRYVLGPWITDFNFEYFPGTAQSRSRAFRRYDERHLEAEISRLRSERIPLSGLVLDFGWHDYGWQGGYDWSPLLAHPHRLIAWLEQRHIRLALNDHPGYAGTRESILSFHDSRAPEVLKALGRPLPPTPSFNMNLSRDFTFRPDPRDLGLKQRWYAPAYPARGWQSIATDRPWQQQGHPGYQGVGWYRAAFRLPGKIPRPLYLYLGEVGGHYRLFVNGQRVAHTHVQWPRRLTYADIALQAKAGERNVIALRIEAGPRGFAGNGILSAPVALRNLRPPHRIWFNLAARRQARVFMRDLHGPLMREGVDFWWVDGGGGAAEMRGLDPQLWTNRVFYDYERRESGKRAFILSRYGGWGSERYPGFFSGDAWSQWPVLAYEVAYTARGGNVLVPYISNDIGGFHGGKIPFALYARWLEFGTFSPILRMHSAHENPLEGNLRMPWIYGARGIALMRRYFRLRVRLMPYIYTYAWEAHETSMPILRPLYLEWPNLPQAYRHFHEYYFGSQMLVAPVLKASGERAVYLPPGRWIDFFTGQQYAGGRTVSARYGANRTPVFVRAGAIIPEQRSRDHVRGKSTQTLLVNVYGSGRGYFELYEDDGVSFAFEKGRYALTPMTYTGSDNRHTLVLGPTRGGFAGQARTRRYELLIHTEHEPVSLVVDGGKVRGWRWDPRRGTATVILPEMSIRSRIALDWK